MLHETADVELVQVSQAELNAAQLVHLLLLRK